MHALLIQFRHYKQSTFSVVGEVDLPTPSLHLTHPFSFSFSFSFYSSKWSSP